MSEVVLDASAVLALFRQEQGAEMVANYMGNACMSPVNLSEVVSVAMGKYKADESIILALIHRMELQIKPFTTEFAYETARMKAATAFAGLSLGDAACLALAKQEHLPVLTSDRIWKTLEIGIDIRLIR